jgi:hypothetical protein
MIKKITMGIVFFMLMSVSVYSQEVGTAEFGLVAQGFSKEMFNEAFSEYSYPIDQGMTRIERLPNSVQNEIARQLTDYRPLTNGQVFYWSGGLAFLGGTHLYIVGLRVSDARNSRWEYFAYCKSVFD